MSSFKKIVSSGLVAATLIGAVTATSGAAQARGFPAAGVAGGIIGAAALGAMAAEARAPRRTYVVYHRHHRHHHDCTCVVRVRSY
jgi:hypothetical protein